MSPIASRRTVVHRLVPDLRRANQPHGGLWLQTALTEQESGGSHEARENLFDEMVVLPVPPVYCDALNRRRALFEALPNTLAWEADLVDRLILGLGDETVHETGLRIEHTYGLPVIPGSSLKGALRAHVHECVVRRRTITDPCWSPDTGEAFHAVFGNTEEAGLVQFHDAWWVPAEPGSGGAEKAFVRDVMTVHHPSYYQAENPAAPSDADSPTPIPFLAVRGSFLFAVTTPSKEWTELLQKMLVDMLATNGVGGKKTTGYGRFKRPRVQEAKVEESGLPADAVHRKGWVRCLSQGKYEICLEDGTSFFAPSDSPWMKPKKKKIQKLKEGKEAGPYLFTLIPRGDGFKVLNVESSGNDVD